MSGPCEDDATRALGAGPRRWGMPRRHFALGAAFAGVLALVTAYVVARLLLGYDLDLLTVLFAAVFWLVLGVALAGWLRTATRVELYEDHSLLISAPVRVVHTSTAGVRRLRRASGAHGSSRPGYVLETVDGLRVRLAHELVTPELIDALRTANPRAALPRADR